jgi:hypothetical protein
MASRRFTVMDSREAASLARLEERLRQERETFDQKRRQDQGYYRLRMVMGAAAIGVFLGICAFSGFVLVNNSEFPSGVIATASSALLVEAVAFVVGVWKNFLGEGPKELEPTTAPPPAES